MSNTFDGVGGEESQILGFQRVVVGEFGRSALRLGFSSQRGVVDFELARLDDTNIGRNTVAKFDFNNITAADFLGFDCLLLAITDDEGRLGNQVLEGFHNFGALALLVVGEASGDDDDGRQYNTEVQLQDKKEWIDHQKFITYGIICNSRCLRGCRGSGCIQSRRRRNRGWHQPTGA